jgi:hypothetical protein
VHGRIHALRAHFILGESCLERAHLVEKGAQVLT